MGINKSRKLKFMINFEPCKAKENDEIYRNGIFQFNISKIMKDIASGKLDVEKETISIHQWFKSHLHHSSINENHISTVDISKPILQGELRPGIFEIIDGNHRIEKAYREKVESISSFKLKGEQLVEYLIDRRGCEAFVEYWNSKL